MAEKKVPTEPTDDTGVKGMTVDDLEAFMMERVPIQLIRDADRYRDDVTVTWNGTNYVIQRGHVVRVPRAIAQILESSRAQELVAAELIDEAKKNKLIGEM